MLWWLLLALVVGVQLMNIQVSEGPNVTRCQQWGANIMFGVTLRKNHATTAPATLKCCTATQIHISSIASSQHKTCALEHHTYLLSTNHHRLNFIPFTTNTAPA
jgi:hypothetical protein